MAIEAARLRAMTLVQSVALCCCSADTPLLFTVRHDSGPASTVDEYLALGRRGVNGRVPGWPTVHPLLSLGFVSYGLPAMLVIQPIFFDDKWREEWFATDPDGGTVSLTAVTMCFFMAWGFGAFLVGYIADRYGRKFATLLCILSMIVLSAAQAAAPTFGVFAFCRALSGAPVGAIGAVIYVLCVEWALPSDNALIASILMINWSGWAVWFVGFTALTDSLGCSWRLQQLLLTLHCAIPLIGFRFSQESPRFHLAHGRVHVAEALLVQACLRGGIAIPEGSKLLPAGTSVTAASSDANDSSASGAASGADTAPAPPAPAPFAAATAAADAEAAAVAPSSSAAADAPGEEAPRDARCGGAYRRLLEPAILYMLLLVGFNWLAVSLLYYGLDFAVAACDPSQGCNRYTHAALTSLVDIPGYFAGSFLADTRLGRRLTASLSLAFGGASLLLTAFVTQIFPTSFASAVSPILTLLGKFAAASAFIQAYLFPTELFATAIRGAALGIGNIFARTGTTLAPLAATAPALVVQLGLGSVSLLAGLATLLLPERRGLQLPD